MAARWTIDAEYAQVPDTKHFIADVAEEERAEIQEPTSSAQIEARVSGAVSNLYHRIAKVVEWVSESLGKERFSGALYRKIQDIVDLVPQLNVTDDPGLDAIVERLRETFAGVDPKALRPKAKGFDAEQVTRRNGFCRGASREDGRSRLHAGGGGRMSGRERVQRIISQATPAELPLSD